MRRSAPRQSGSAQLCAGGCIALLWAVLATAGCDQQGRPAWGLGGLGPTQAGESAVDQAGNGQASETVASKQPAISVATFTFDVLRVRVPQGLLSESGKIWNHLDSDFLAADTTKVLHRNGLRVGRAGADSWPPIRALLETEPRVETAQSRLIMSNGLPLLLEVDQRPRNQILFLYRRDGSLAGAPWRESTNLLRVEYGIPPAQPNAVLLEVTPELRLDSAAAQTARGPEQWNMAPVHEPSLAIRDLSFRAQLAPGEFLAIGPSSTTRELPYIMGSLLLCEQQAGERFESMYLITPSVTRTGAEQ